MERMPFKRPTEHYNEGIKEIDEKICELISKRKEISKDNLGYPPFEYISSWAEKFNLYEDFLKLLFSTLMNEKMYKPLIKPEGFRKNLIDLKCIEVDDRIFSVTCIRQYSNASVVNFNIDWDGTDEVLKASFRKHNSFKMFINDKYECQILDGTGGNGHFHYNFVVSPALPDDLSEIEVVFKEYEHPFIDKPVGEDIIIRL